MSSRLERGNSVMKKNMKKHSVIKRTVCIILIIRCIITLVYSYYGVTYKLDGKKMNLKNMR